ncbi:MAG: ATP-binding cassette domain-containing protein [Gammaproteobacteria bacterium]
MIDLTRKLSKLYGHFFGFHGEGAKRSAALLGIIGINIALAFLISMINASFNSFIGVLDLPEITYTAFFGAALEFMGGVLVYAAIASFNMALSRWLGDSLATEKTLELNRRWNIQNTPFLYKFFEASKKLNPAQIIEQHSRETAQHSMTLLNTLLMTTCNAIVGIIGLWRLSSTLTLVIMGAPLQIPGYMALASFLYSLSYNLIMGYLGRQLHTHETATRELQGEVNRQLNHTAVLAEPIALRKGASFEQERTSKILQEQIGQYRTFFIATASLGFLRTLHQRLTFAIGLMLSAPEIIAKRINTAQLFEVSEYFSFVVSLFTWRQDNFEAVTQMTVGAERLEQFETLLSGCEALAKNKSYQIEYLNTPNEPICFSNLAVKTPNGETCIRFPKLEIPQGTRLKVSGETGMGKTTLLRMLSNIWPYGEGQIRFPAPESDIIRLSQEACFPFRSTLLEAISYPVNSADVDCQQIQTWMCDLGLEKYSDQLNTSAEWGKVLSGGEKQRIALLSLLVHRPIIAILDESFSALDDKTIQVALSLLTKILPNTTFLCVDHAPEIHNGFYTHTLHLEKGLEPTLQAVSAATRLVH